MFHLFSQLTRPVRAMSRRLALLIPFILSGPIAAQTPPVLPPATTAPATPVAPPLPGQLQAAPAAPPSRIPDLPSPAATPVPGTPLTSNKALPSTSNSGQFIVHGNDLPLRSAFSTRCEEIHEELRTLLKDKQPWVLPIVVLLNSGEAARKAGKTVIMTLSQIDQAGFHIQVTINLRPDLRPADFRAELIRALLHERILRQKSVIPEKRTSLLPDWVYTGVMEALDYRKQTRPSTLFAAIFKSGKIFGIEEIIEASPTQMDALSKTIYQTSCCALVLALLDQPEGGARLNRFLASLAGDPQPERELLDQAFPSFATSPASLNKWWALQLASLSRPGLAEPLSPQETVNALEDALTFRYQARASEVPKPRPVVARITPSPATVVVSPPKADASPVSTIAETAPEVASTEDKKRSFFSRLNPFSRRKSASDEAVIDAAIEEAARDEAKARADSEIKSSDSPVASTPPIELPSQSADAKDQVPAIDERKPIFNRWFGGGKTSAAKKPEGKPDIPKDDVLEPAPLVEPENIPTDKKPSGWNPLNWLRRSKAPESSEPAPEKPAEESGEKPVETASTFLDQWLPEAGGPLIAFFYQEATTEEVPAKKKKLFGLFGGDKKPKPAAEPKPLEPQKPKESEPKAEDKSQKTTAPDGTKDKVENKAPTETQSKIETKSEKAPQPKAETGSPPPAPEDKNAPVAMPAEPKPEDDQPKAEKPKREPLRLKSLFGSGKKAEEEGKAMDDASTKPDEKDAPPAADAMVVEKPAPQQSTSDEKPQPTKPEKKQEPSKDKTTELKANEGKPMPSSQGIGEQKPAPAMAVKAEKPEQVEPARKQELPKAKSVESAVKRAPAAENPKIDPNEPLVAVAVPVEDFASIMKRPDHQAILQRSLLSLNALQQRSAVLFRPIVADYMAVVADLAEGKTKNADDRLKQLRRRVQTALDQSKAIRDQLDTHEANSLPAMSGAFDDFLKLPETIRNETPARQDPISKYLDALDREFARP
jgi:hypothetical protein